MSPRLRVLAGPNPDSMVPITSIVNTSNSHLIHSELFQGQVVANIRGMTDEYGQIPDSEYFQREDRQGVTWSIQVQGIVFIFFFFFREGKRPELYKDVSWFLHPRMIFYLETPLIGR